ncbi:MAG: hypothetical protein SVT52_07930 [Planctomycetota bacterium]|nr:hypothetical protein [Planctomycetota bacterium]
MEPSHGASPGARPARGVFRIERGRRFWPIDAIGNLLSILDKVFLFNWRVGSRSISSAIEFHVREFATKHELRGVTFRLNQYAPFGELARLFRNERMSWVFRVCFGFPYFLTYTLWPWRLFGGDCFVPFRNSVHLFSDHIAIALHEAGHALDFSRRRFLGAYMLLRFIPLGVLYQEFLASKYALGYLKELGDKKLLREAYKVLVPAFFTYILGTLVPTTLQTMLLLPMLILGHLIGRVLAFTVA